MNSIKHSIKNLTDKLPTFSSLFSVSGDAKTTKGLKYGYITAIQYLAPSRVSGIVNLCKWASDGCINACLNTAGRASFDTQISKARINRTIWFVRDKMQYWARFTREIDALIRKGIRDGLTPVVRPNGTSDQPYERMKIKGTRFDGMTIFEAYPEIQFYDYTKAPFSERPIIPDNYHLTYSYNENTTPEMIAENINNGRNVAVVFNVCKLDNRKKCHNKCTCPFPATWNGFKVISGDENDIRFKDEVGVIVALHAKGKARFDTSGFVVDLRKDLKFLNDHFEIIIAS